MLMLFFLSSGLFLGWSLGANDASNIFGTAVSTRMVRFKSAALICSIFVILGAVFSGTGAAYTLGQLGSVNAIAGSFLVALSAAISVYLMTRMSLPVSTSQAIVGAIIGWNFFSGSLTDYNSLTKIVGTWFICPILAAILAIIIYAIFKFILKVIKIHLLRLDAYTRFGLIIVGAFGSYSLGANNIANVMGVFVPVAPFKTVNFYNIFHVTNAHQLFLLGALAIAVGVFTYSYKVMATVGNELVKLTPLTALIVVLSQSLVLFIFASQGLSDLFTNIGLPAIPLVPVSSSQAVIGAVLGVGIIKGVKGIKLKIMGDIVLGWITTPIIAAVICFIALFFLQNVFKQQVFRPVHYKLTELNIQKLTEEGMDLDLNSFKGYEYENARNFIDAITENTEISNELKTKIIYYSEIDYFAINSDLLKGIDKTLFSPAQIVSLNMLAGLLFKHKWVFHDALITNCADWKYLSDGSINRRINDRIKMQLDYLYDRFRVDPLG